MFGFKRVVKGTAFTSQSINEIDILENYLFCLNEDGMIEKLVSPKEEIYSAIIETYQGTSKFQEIPKGEYLLPGFIDLHVHAPQWPQSGLALDKPLYDWLNTYTFPLEAKYKDTNFAEKVYSHLVDELLSLGTTTVLYFGTIHKEANLKLAEICAKKGQRGLVGKVVMDDHEANPKFYRDETTEQALADTEEFIKDVKILGKNVKQGVYPVVTPRFIPSCTDEGLKGLGELAEKYDVHVQSHCSESDWAHQFVIDRFGESDTKSLNKFGLLNDKSVMAHCGFLSAEDTEIFRETGTAVAHCPISNAYFGNAVTRVKQLLHDYQVDVGLGTDISGGFSPSLYDNMKQAVMSSRMLNDGVNHEIESDERGVSNSNITLKEAFYLATAGGGKSLSLPIGELKEGFTWDAQVVSTHHLPVFGEDTLEETFQKLIYLMKPEQIKEVWVQDQLVYKQ
ncbi:guanine deaminase [Vagococcus fluvialis]|uniref:guanine deaminase n=1 Tax=Vagococcus fluvialis TaxID=2738 RepID=UPI001D0B80D0|nr:guanine deaminase [Vagococcus fluvialis]UDM70229.1 guanine deaminase [Vagococcus fluvialis]UDM77648.1 guanine deaminase [Vagococcus fluvialis]UDM81918.1 guanine deaminase [Vagococcus fluvialis]